ncbi:hypothetical protein [Streptomyces griseoluteus]|uniref:hypothetical protein n=1 Tax=Streptomyces griseoluteus TaxID=29306 RepID=UPI0036DFDDAE
MSESPGAAALRAAAHRTAAQFGHDIRRTPGNHVVPMSGTAVEIRLFLPWTRPAWPAAGHTRPVNARLRELLAAPFRHGARVKAVDAIGGLSISAYVAPERSRAFLTALTRLPELMPDMAVPLLPGEPVATGSPDESIEDVARRQALRLLPAGPDRTPAEDHTRPDWGRAHLVVVGPVDDRADIPTWAASHTPSVSPAVNAPDSPTGPHVGRHTHDVSAVGIACPLSGAPAAEELAATVVGGSHAADLVEILRERLGVAYAPAMVVHRRAGLPHLWTWLPVAPRHFRLLTRTVALATSRPRRCDEDRLDRAKSHLAGKLERALCEPRALANLLVEHPPHGSGPESLRDHYMTVADTSPHEVDAAAERLLARRAVLVTGPDNTSEALENAFSHHGG